MPWTPLFQARFIRPFITNLITVIQRDEREALLWANDGQAMAAFKVYRKARWINTLFPAISVIPRRSEVEQAQDNSRLEEEHTVEVEIEDLGQDPDVLAEMIERRVQAVDMIIRSASRADIAVGYEPGRWGALLIEISPHEFTQFFNERQSIYKQTGTFGVTFNCMER